MPSAIGLSSIAVSTLNKQQNARENV